MAFVILCVGCDAIKPDNGVQRLGGQKWKLTAIDHKPVNGEGKAYLEFDEKEMEVAGKAFCNSVKAEYELMGRNQLTFEEVTSTKMFCDGVMDLENQMVTNLQSVRRYEIKNGTLYLYSTDQLLLTFTK